MQLKNSDTLTPEILRAFLDKLIMKKPFHLIYCKKKESNPLKTT